MSAVRQLKCTKAEEPEIINLTVLHEYTNTHEIEIKKIVKTTFWTTVKDILVTYLYGCVS